MSKLYKKIAPFLATSFTDIGFHKNPVFVQCTQQGIQKKAHHPVCKNHPLREDPLSTARQPRQCERRLHNT